MSRRLPSIAEPTLGAVGMSASLLCVVHCAALPLFLTASPALGLALESAAWLGWVGIAVAGLATGATLPAAARRHGDRRPLLLAGAGILAMMAGEWWATVQPGWPLAITAAGAAAVMGAHLLDLKRRRECRVCGHADCAKPVGSEATAAGD